MKKSLIHVRGSFAASTGEATWIGGWGTNPDSGIEAGLVTGCPIDRLVMGEHGWLAEYTGERRGAATARFLVEAADSVGRLIEENAWQ